MRTAKPLLKLLLLSAYLMAVCAFAEVKKIDDVEYSVQPDREDGMYKKGEECVFTFSASKDGEPVELEDVRMSLSQDGCAPTVKFQKPVKSGNAWTVKGTSDKPGFLQCKAYCSIGGKKDKVAIVAGAAYDPNEIKASMPAPDDFDAFWLAQKKIMAAIPMNIKLTPINSGEKGILAFDLEADTFNGKLRGFLAFPEGAKDKSLPALLTCHGAGVRSSTRATAVSWAKNGFVSLDFNAHGILNAQSAEYYKDLQEGELKNYASKNNDDREKVFFRTLYMRLMRAIDALCAQPQWDGKTLVVFGTSQGGGQAIAAAGLDSRVSLAIANVPAMCDLSAPTIGRMPGWPRQTQPDAEGNYPKDIVEASRYWDAMNFAARAKCPIIMTAGFRDVVCPPSSVYAAFSNAKSAGSRIIPAPDCGHALPQKYFAEESKIVEEFIKSRK